MRALVVITATLACVWAGEIPEEMREMAQGLHDSCVEETGVDNSLIAPCGKGQFADDPKLKCYFKCVFGNIGVISDDGDLDADAFGSILPEELQGLLPTIKTCAGTTGSDPCDLAMKFNQCLQKADPVNFMVI
uniref:Odorant-binding protein 19 n=1 Tax=Cyrtorhinus lividipennis TaxID=1032904 RepID=A0A346TI01_9HEMI|nr:odorant-binding protein 19 [Cyrtorhinus lividipennis]